MKKEKKRGERRTIGKECWIVCSFTIRAIKYFDVRDSSGKQAAGIVPIKTEFVRCSVYMVREKERQGDRDRERKRVKERRACITTDRRIGLTRVLLSAILICRRFRSQSRVPAAKWLPRIIDHLFGPGPMMPRRCSLSGSGSNVAFDNVVLLDRPRADAS